jgi:hypothetical protein
MKDGEQIKRVVVAVIADVADDVLIRAISGGIEIDRPSIVPESRERAADHSGRFATYQYLHFGLNPYGRGADSPCSARL